MDNTIYWKNLYPVTYADTLIQSWLIDMIMQEEYAELGWLWSYTKMLEFSFAGKDGCAERAKVGMTVVRSTQFCLSLNGW